MQEIVKTLSAIHSIPQDRVRLIIADLFKEISNQVEKGERISIKNVGSFFQKVRAPRNGFNPKTKEPIKIGEVRKLGFSSRVRY